MSPVSSPTSRPCGVRNPFHLYCRRYRDRCRCVFQVHDADSGKHNSTQHHNHGIGESLFKKCSFHCLTHILVFSSVRPYSYVAYISRYRPTTTPYLSKHTDITHTSLVSLYCKCAWRTGNVVICVGGYDIC